MRRLFIAMVAFLVGVTTCYSQDYIQNGKEFTVKKKVRVVGEDVKTGYTWKDSKGKTYDIYISSRGSCYIIRTSSKTGKKYKSYLPKELSAEIAKELGVKK